MTRFSVQFDLPDLEVTIIDGGAVRWVGVFDGEVLVGLAEVCEEADNRCRAHLFVPVCSDTDRLRVELADHPGELAG